MEIPNCTVYLNIIINNIKRPYMYMYILRYRKASYSGEVKSVWHVVWK